MKKEDLTKQGLTAEQADNILKIISDSYIEKSVYTLLEKERDGLKTDLQNRDTQLKGLKKSAEGNEDLQKTINKLQQDNKAAEAKYQTEIHQLKFDNAVERALSANKAKNLKAVKALLSLEDAKLQDDGTIKGLAEQLEALKKAEDSSFLFDVSTGPKLKGVKPGQSTEDIPPAGKGPGEMSYEDWLAAVTED